MVAPSAFQNSFLGTLRAPEDPQGRGKNSVFAPLIRRSSCGTESLHFYNGLCRPVPSYTVNMQRFAPSIERPLATAYSRGNLAASSSYIVNMQRFAQSNERPLYRPRGLSRTHFGASLGDIRPVDSLDSLTAHCYLLTANS